MIIELQSSKAPWVVPNWQNIEAWFLLLCLKDWEEELADDREVPSEIAASFAGLQA